MGKNKANGKNTKIIRGVQPLTQNERNGIYMEVMFALMNLQVWDISDPAMQRFKIIMKLYLDHGREDSGELNIDSIGRKLIYNLYNDRNKKTVAYLSQKKYQREIDKKIDTQPKKQVTDLSVDPEELKALRQKETAGQLDS